MTLQKAILLFRAKNRISQKDFAALCGVSVQTVYNIETIGQSPSKLTAAKIGLVLGDEYALDREE